MLLKLAFPSIVLTDPDQSEFLHRRLKRKFQSYSAEQVIKWLPTYLLEASSHAPDLPSEDGAHQVSPLPLAATYSYEQILDRVRSTLKFSVVDYPKQDNHWKLEIYDSENAHSATPSEQQVYTLSPSQKVHLEQCIADAFQTTINAYSFHCESPKVRPLLQFNYTSDLKESDDKFRAKIATLLSDYPYYGDLKIPKIKEHTSLDAACAKHLICTTDAPPSSASECIKIFWAPSLPTLEAIARRHYFKQLPLTHTCITQQTFLACMHNLLESKPTNTKLKLTYDNETMSDFTEFERITKQQIQHANAPKLSSFHSNIQTYSFCTEEIILFYVRQLSDRTDISMHCTAYFTPFEIDICKLTSNLLDKKYLDTIKDYFFQHMKKAH